MAMVMPTAMVVCRVLNSLGCVRDLELRHGTSVRFASGFVCIVLKRRLSVRIVFTSTFCFCRGLFPARSKIRDGPEVKSLTAYMPPGAPLTPLRHAP